MIEAPATEARVPSTFALPSLLSNRTCSNLQANIQIIDTIRGYITAINTRIRGKKLDELYLLCLNKIAIRNVTAGTEFSIAEAKVGDVKSKPSM